MNIRGIWAIYKFELNRSRRTIVQSLIAPVASTSLYFVVFGSAIGHSIKDVHGIPYATYIVPGLVILTILSHSVSNAGFGIFMPRLFGTIFEILSAPLSYLEVTTAYCGAALTKSIIIATVVLLSASLLVDLNIMHPFWMIFFLFITCLTFCLIGFIIGFWARTFEQLNIVPMLVISPLTFLGGSFYSIEMLPPFWRNISLLNPVVYLISGVKWSFYEVSDVSLAHSLVMIFIFITAAIGMLAYMYNSGRFLRT